MHLRTLVQHGPRPFAERARATPGSVHLFDADADAVAHAGPGGGRAMMLEDTSPAAALSVRLRAFESLAEMARSPAGAAALRAAAPDIVSALSAEGVAFAYHGLH